MSLPITHTVDETMKMIAERAADPAAANEFFLKVYRRRATVQYGKSPSEHVATFNGASTVHFAQPEAWLPALFGGGDYELYAYDPVDAGKRIGGMLIVGYPTDNNPQKSKPDFRVMRSQAWAGPRGLVFPSMDEPAATTTPLPLHTTPAVSTSQQAAAQQQNGAAAVVPDWVIREREQAAEARRQLELQVERERAERKAEAEAAKLRAEMDRAQAANDKQMSELRALMAAQAAAKPAGPDLAATVTALLGVLAPLAIKFMESSAEQRRLDAARADAQTAAQTAMLTKLAEPKGMPSEVTMLFEVMKGQATASGEMMSRMVDATQAFNGMAVTMIQTMAENLGGNEGNPILDGAKDIIKTVVALQRGTETAGRRQAQQMVQSAQQLPASQPQPPLRPQNGNGAAATGPQTPVPVTNFPAQQHAQPAAPIPQGFDGLPPVVPNDTVAAIEGMIRNHDEPSKVVDFIVGRIDAKDEALFSALDEHGGDVEALIGGRLGGWAILPANTSYLTQLGATWQEKAAAAGLLEDEGGEDEVEAAPEA